MKKLFLFLLSSCFLCGCDRDDNEYEAGVNAKVRVTLPDVLSAGGVYVEWTNHLTGAVYKADTDTAGVAVCQVEPGIYRVAAEKRMMNEAERREELYRGGLEQVTVGVSGTDTVLEMKRVTLGALVVKEVYYAGCFVNEKDPYSKDNYVILYNNSAETIWLDGLCVGIAGPVVTTGISEWLTDDPQLPEVPIYRCGWQFPGSGNEYPLAPGTETVIAVNAVDHTSGKYGHSESVDLSKADWAFYNDNFNPEQSAITPGVKKLSLFWLNWTGALLPSFSLGVDGPGLVVYRIEGDAAAYAETHQKYVPGKPETPTFRYLMIPREWVLDYVECVNGVGGVSCKRVPAALDKSAAFVSQGKWSGLVLRRKIERVENGRIIYQDLNDSRNDFEEGEPSLK